MKALNEFDSGNDEKNVNKFSKLISKASVTIQLNLIKTIQTLFSL